MPIFFANLNIHALKCKNSLCMEQIESLLNSGEQVLQKQYKCDVGVRRRLY